VCVGWGGGRRTSGHRGQVVMIRPRAVGGPLRKYYKKHTKNDRLDSLVLSRVAAAQSEGAHRGEVGSGRLSRSSVLCVDEWTSCTSAAPATSASMPCWTCWAPAYHEALGSRGTKTRRRGPRALREPENPGVGWPFPAHRPWWERRAVEHLGAEYAARATWFTAATEAHHTCGKAGVSIRRACLGPRPGGSAHRSARHRGRTSRYSHRRALPSGRTPKASCARRPGIGSGALAGSPGAWACDSLRQPGGQFARSRGSCPV